MAQLDAFHLLHIALGLEVLALHQIRDFVIVVVLLAILAFTALLQALVAFCKLTQRC
jgi:hypothetical protein